MRYNVYKIYPNAHYSGSALVAASSAQEANTHISAFKESDENNNCDSWGYRNVNETDIIEDTYSERNSILDYGIYYSG